MRLDILEGAILGTKKEKGLSKKECEILDRQKWGQIIEREDDLSYDSYRDHQDWQSDFNSRCN